MTWKKDKKVETQPTEFKILRLLKALSKDEKIYIYSTRSRLRDNVKMIVSSMKGNGSRSVSNPWYPPVQIMYN